MFKMKRPAQTTLWKQLEAKYSAFKGYKNSLGIGRPAITFRKENSFLRWKD